MYLSYDISVRGSSSKMESYLKSQDISIRVSKLRVSQHEKSIKKTHMIIFYITVTLFVRKKNTIY